MTQLRVPFAFAFAFVCSAGAAHAQEEGGGMDFGESDAPAAEAPAEPPAEPPPEGVESGIETPPANDAGASALDEGINLTLQDRIKAVSRKVFLKEGRFELQPAIAVTTNDPFFRTWSVAARGAYHLNDAFAFEVGGSYVPPYFREKLPAVDILRDAGNLINADAELLGTVDAGITFSPVYGKLAILSDAIIHFDAFAIAGGGVVMDKSDDFIHPTMDIGAGLRVFLLRWLVVRADLRDYIYPQDRLGISTLQNLLVFTAGVGFYFPFDFEYRYEAARVRS